MEEAFSYGQGGALVEEGKDVGKFSLFREELESI